MAEPCSDADVLDAGILHPEILGLLEQCLEWDPRWWLVGLVGLTKLLLSKVDALLAADGGEVAGVVQVTIVYLPYLPPSTRR